MGTVERAFELAASGACRTIDDIRRRLGTEGYPSVDAHLAGSAIRRQLKALIEAAGTST